MWPVGQTFKHGVRADTGCLLTRIRKKRVAKGALGAILLKKSEHLCKTAIWKGKKIPKWIGKQNNLHTAFKRFNEHANFMFEGPLSNKTEAIRCNYLMLWVGDKGRHIYSTWTIEDGDEKKLKTELKSNKIYNRYDFKSRVQKENEKFEQFVTEFKTLIKDCDYPAATTDEHIRDHIVFV